MNEPSADRALAAVGGWLRADRLPFFSALLFGLLAHGFQLLNKIPVDDDLPNMWNKGATTVSGRYGLELLRLVMPDVSMPWLWGLLSLLFLALAVCLVVRLFSIESRALQLLLAGVFVCFPAETGTLAYMFTAAPYALALLLTVLGVSVFAAGNRGRWLLAPLLLAFSCSVYQGYFAFAASFCVILMVRRLAEGGDARTVLSEGLRLLGMLLLSLAVYGLAILTASRLLGLPLLGEAVNSRQSLPLRAAVAYSAWLKTLFKGYFAYVPSLPALLCHLLLIGCAGAALVLRVKGRPLPDLLLLGLCLFLFPLSCYCLYLLADNGYIHSLALYPFASLYVLCAVLLDGDGPRFALPLRRLASLALALILFGQVVFANAFTLRAKLQYEQTRAMYTAILAQVFDTEGFDEHSRLALIGDAPAGRTELDGHFPFAQFQLPGVNITDPLQAEPLIRNYLGCDIPFADEAECAALADEAELAAMPVWPYAGSVKKLGDLIVVKLSSGEGRA